MLSQVCCHTLMIMIYRVNDFIVGKMIRNEKLLSGMAGGVFILKPSYVIESEKEKKWMRVSRGGEGGGEGREGRGGQWGANSRVVV